MAAHEHSYHRMRSLQLLCTSNHRQEARDFFRRRTMSFPGLLPNGTVASQLDEDATKEAKQMLLNWKNEWVQLAGHKGTFAPAGPGTLWKKQESQHSESRTYRALVADPAHRCVPRYHRQLCHNGNYYIEIDDLLHGFCDPNVMDIKMGTRTFLESEVQNPSLRKDLYEKLINLAPEAATDEEKQQMAITKLRYMKLREEMSSSSTLGFRIDALRMSGNAPDCSLKKVRSMPEVQRCLRQFLRGSPGAAQSLLQRLLYIRRNLEQSSFFATHELIGSSLLVLHDSRGNVNCWMIDFGKTRAVDSRLDHRTSWSMGNHEDGYLHGLDNLIEVFNLLVEEQTSEQLSSKFTDLNCNSRSEIADHCEIGLSEQCAESLDVRTS